MNLAELIKPVTYKLNESQIRYTPSEIKQMTDYDTQNTSECKDMLELILRAKNHNSWLPTFIELKSDQDITNLNEYAHLVACLAIEYFYLYYIPSEADLTIDYFVPATGRMADFCKLMPNPKLESCVLAAQSRYSEDLYLVMEYKSKVFSLGKINKWQAQYITIRNVIINLGEKAKINGTMEQLHEMYNADVPDTPVATTSKQTDEDADYENVTAEVKNTSVTKNATVEVKVAATNEINVAATKEMYEKLFKHGEIGLFHTEAVKHNVELLRMKDFLMEVKINDDNTVALHNDIEYPIIGSQPDKKIQTFIDHVKSVPIRGDENNFAYPGFRFNGELCKIKNMPYKTMYSYVIQEGNDLSMIPKDLVELTVKIRQEVANLPEITDFCSDAIVDEYENYIRISHDGNEMHTCVCSLGQSTDHVQTIKSRELVGRFHGGLHLFLMIGIRKYKIMEIFEAEAAEVFVKNTYLC